MSQAEDLLNSLDYSATSGDTTNHHHEVIDNDSYFTIDPVTRLITNTSDKELKIMQFDHRSERFTFELPRYIEGHDMSLCNVVEVHYTNIGNDGSKNEDVHDIYDLHIDEDDSDKVVCSWLIERSSTLLDGTLEFVIRYQCLDVDGTSPYEWHTDKFTDVIVKKGMNNSGSAVEEHRDILEQWRSKLFASPMDSVEITLYKDAWTISENNEYYTQTLSRMFHLKSYVNLYPTAQQLVDIARAGLTMFAGNDNGVVTVFCVGGVPSVDITMEVAETVVGDV